ncbi:glycosyltransferase [uncultured Algibacter sp.]|uniref:glycosyltransferase n=1 Tax=uncultured Algibacter sp. TaxID=298659 RepID=UPI0032171A76
MNHKKHICIIVDCLCGGGAEKVAATLSFLLENNDYKVSIIAVRNEITYNYRGILYNLGENESSIKWVRHIKKVLLFRKYYKLINADFYIDFRMRDRFIMESLLHFLVFENRKMIFSIQHYNIAYHIPKGKIFKRLYNKAKTIVAVSLDIEKELKRYHSFSNIKYIPNFVNKDLLTTSKVPPKDVPNNAILAIGRLNNPVKQFDKLILSYKNTSSFIKGIPLFILGDGPDRLKLETLIESNNLQAHVKLLGFVSNPYDYIKQCKFLVLCSKFEGMPLVILEALTLEKPVISFNCKSGPSELIVHKENGLLINNQDFHELEKSIDLLQQDKALYNKMINNAQKSVDKFDAYHMIKHWESCFNI